MSFEALLADIVATTTSITPPEKPVIALISSVAKKRGIASTTLYNLANSESTLDPDAEGDEGCSFGIVQINLCAHPSIDKEDALDPEFALDYAAKSIANGTDSTWTSCNCYSLVSTKIKGLPRMSSIQPNGPARVGGVAIFYYPKKGTGEIVKHIAYIQYVGDSKITIQEANMTHCLIDTRTVALHDPHLSGFWHA